MNDWVTKINLHRGYFNLPIPVTHRLFMWVNYNKKNAETNCTTIWPFFPDCCSIIKLDCRVSARKEYKTSYVSRRLHPCEPGQGYTSRTSNGYTTRIPGSVLKRTASNHGFAHIKGASGKESIRRIIMRTHLFIVT